MFLILTGPACWGGGTRLCCCPGAIGLADGGIRLCWPGAGGLAEGGALFWPGPLGTWLDGYI